MIHYVTGDATQPIHTPAIIAHVCNDAGAWGRGFALAISARWRAPEQAYRAWHRSGSEFGLGRVQLVEVDSDIHVANMVAQKGVRSARNRAPLMLDALEKCLRRVRLAAELYGASVHMPRIGCGLAGGSWDVIGGIVDLELAGVEVFVYDLPCKSGQAQFDTSSSRH